MTAVADDGKFCRSCAVCVGSPPPERAVTKPRSTVGGNGRRRFAGEERRDDLSDEGRARLDQGGEGGGIEAFGREGDEDDVGRQGPFGQGDGSDQGRGEG